MIACKTTIGFGAPTKANSSEAHGSPLGAEEIQATRAALNWPHEPFHIPESIMTSWAEIGARHQSAYNQWKLQTPNHMQEALQAPYYNIDEAINAYKRRCKLKNQAWQRVCFRNKF